MAADHDGIPTEAAEGFMRLLGMIPKEQWEEAFIILLPLYQRAHSVGWCEGLVEYEQRLRNHRRLWEQVISGLADPDRFTDIAVATRVIAGVAELINEERGDGGFAPQRRLLVEVLEKTFGIDPEETKAMIALVWQERAFDPPWHWATRLRTPLREVWTGAPA